MGADSLLFGVEKAKINWGTFFRDTMRGGSATSQFENYSGRGPSVVVQNANGEKRVLEVTKNSKDAQDSRDRKRLQDSQHRRLVSTLQRSGFVRLGLTLITA